MIFSPIGFFFPFFKDRVGLPGLPPGPDLGLSDREGFTGAPSGLLVGGWGISDGGEGGASAGSGAGGGANGAGSAVAMGGRSKEGAGGGAKGGSSSAISSPKEGGAIGGN